MESDALVSISKQVKVLFMSISIQYGSVEECVVNVNNEYDWSVSIESDWTVSVAFLELSPI